MFDRGFGKAKLLDQVRDAIRAIAPEAEIAVELVWEPPWHAGLMSERAKKHFGW